MNPPALLVSKVTKIRRRIYRLEMMRFIPHAGTSRFSHDYALKRAREAAC